MELFITVTHKGASASFAVRREEPGVYAADLVAYTGVKKNSPPPNITLTRGIRHWAGSYEDESLLAHLGMHIEAFFREPGCRMVK